jgi:hypothetical protein
MNSFLAIFLPMVFVQVIVMITIIPQTNADALNPALYSIDESPFGIPYSTWIARWWNWTTGISATENHPRESADRSCDVHQEWKNVWFLPDVLNGNMVRNCEVPLGRAIFVPVTTGEKSVAEQPSLTAKSPDEVKKELIEGTHFCDNYNEINSAQIDGRKILGLAPNSTTYRTNTSDLFQLNWAKGNIYNTNPIQDRRAFAEGWFLFVKPLPQGDHTIEIHSSINKGDNNCDYNGSTKWNIKVK